MSRTFGERPPYDDDETYDCVLRTEDGGEFEAHRALLGAASPFFRASFCAGYGGRQDVLLPGVSAPVLRVLLPFLHSRELSLSNGNVLDVLEAADKLLWDAARDECLAHLLRNIDHDNCFSLAIVALRYHCPDFKNSVVNYINYRFDSVWKRCEGFLHLPVAFLQELLASDELNVRHEADLLYAIYHWHTHNLPVDDNVTLGLLRCVRVGVCDQPALDEARKRLPALAQIAAYQQAIDDALERGSCKCPLNEQLRLPDSCRQCGGSSPQRWLPRIPHEVLFVAAGSTGDSLAMQVYDPRAKRWLLQRRHNMPSPRTLYGLALCGKQLYVVGGMQQSRHVGSLLRFDTEGGVWEELAPMTVARANVSVVALRDDIYVIGGCTATGCTPTVERYSTPSNQWTSVAPLKRRRAYAAACAFKGRVYVSGGRGAFGRALLCVEEYVPSAGGYWRLICPLPSPRHSHQMVCHDGRVYVIGGSDGRRNLKSVQRSQRDSMQDWHDVSPMLAARKTFAAAELDGELYVIGGLGDTRLSVDVERYAPATKHWRSVMPLNGPLSSVSAFTVKGLPSARKFLSFGN